jgi:hypothetical protein
VERPDSARFDAKRRHLAVLLASGLKVVDAAAQVKVATRTAFTWLSDRHLRAYVDSLRAGMLEEAASRLAAAATQAVDVLVSLLTDPEPTVRLRASTAILDALIKVRTNIEFERRIATLEARNDPAIEDLEVGEDDEFDQAGDGFGPTDAEVVARGVRAAGR